MQENYEEFKELVRENSNILTVVSEYVSLKKKGNRYWGCCPFHSEKTASFSVTPEKGLFYCFGCHAGGDVFAFLMKIDNIDFPTAVKALANKLNIPIPERSKSEAEKTHDLYSKRIYHTNDLAVKFFHSCLLNTKYGKTGLEYLSKRGINESTIEKFSIGLAPPSFDSFHKAMLIKKDIDENLLIKAGLVVEKTNKNIYDRFRGRIMIPIQNARGNTVAFGGRVLDEGVPKYLNTAETEWFSKKHLLFAFDIAIKEIRKHKQAIVVEGYMDAITLHAHGINWAVASLGTAFSEEQAKLIKKVASEVIFSFDNDEAGLKAANRSVEIANKIGLKNRVLVVDGVKDPDEYIRLNGKEKYLSLIEKAVTGTLFQINELMANNKFETLEEKGSIVLLALPILMSCQNNIERGLYLKKIASLLTIDESLIKEEYEKMENSSIRENKPLIIAVPKKELITSIDQIERQLIYALLLNLTFFKNNLNNLMQIKFSDKKREKIFSKMVSLLNNNVLNIKTGLFEGLPSEISSELVEILQQELPMATTTKVIVDCLKKIELRRLEHEFKKHSTLASEYESAGDERVLQELLKLEKIKNIIKEILKK